MWKTTWNRYELIMVGVCYQWVGIVKDVVILLKIIPIRIFAIIVAVLSEQKENVYQENRGNGKTKIALKHNCM